MTLSTLSPAQAQAAVQAGARLIDIREADEYARERIPGAINAPVARLHTLELGDRPAIFHCRSGHRTSTHAGSIERLPGNAQRYLLDGGLDAWRGHGLETVVDRRQPLELMRQVQLVAGALVLIGVALGLAASPAFFALAGFVGAGLMFAGATGWCGMARLLRAMPWNRRAAA